MNVVFLIPDSWISSINRHVMTPFTTFLLSCHLNKFRCTHSFVPNSVKKICCYIKKQSANNPILDDTIVPERIILVTGRDLQQNQGQEASILLPVGVERRGETKISAWRYKEKTQTTGQRTFSNMQQWEGEVPDSWKLCLPSCVWRA